VGDQWRPPLSDTLSAGILTFDIDGRSPDALVSSLRALKVITSVAPYATPHVRLTPSIRNSSAEVEEVLRIVRSFA